MRRSRNKEYTTLPLSAIGGDKCVVSAPDMKVSLCITCKNRLFQLEQTFPSNVKAVIEDGDAELVVLNYNSQDGLDEWMQDYRHYVTQGVLRYGHEQTAEHYHASRAKNLSHFLASGQFVVNLDADNFIDGSIPEMRRSWVEDPSSVLWLWSGLDHSDGTFGRIGLSKSLFLRSGGYDEEFLPMAVQDRDLLTRLSALGFPYRRITAGGARALRNSTAEKCAYLGSELSYDDMDSLNRQQMERNVATGRLVANERRQRVRIGVDWQRELWL